MFSICGDAQYVLMLADLAAVADALISWSPLSRMKSCDTVISSHGTSAKPLVKKGLYVTAIAAHWACG